MPRMPPATWRSCRTWWRSRRGPEPDEEAALKVTREIPIVLLGVLLLSSYALAGRAPAGKKPESRPEIRKDWPAYGGGPEDIRYSTLTQINRANVGQLEVAWTYDSGEG